jgi:hypothetical protein
MQPGAGGRQRSTHSWPGAQSTSLHAFWSGTHSRSQSTVPSASVVQCTSQWLPTGHITSSHTGGGSIGAHTDSHAPHIGSAGSMQSGQTVMHSLPGGQSIGQKSWSGTHDGAQLDSQPGWFGSHARQVSSQW